MEQSPAADPWRSPDAADGSREVAGSPTLNLKELRQGSESLVSLSGELDLSSAPPLRELLSRVLEEDSLHRLVVDLSDLIYLDSTGLSVFVTAHKRASASGIQFCLANPNPSVGHLFKVTALDQVFEIVGSTDASGPAAAGHAVDDVGSAELR
jgi:anti-sigma B factor antagonist